MMCTPPTTQTAPTGSGMLFWNSLKTRITTCCRITLSPIDMMNPFIGRSSVKRKRPSFGDEPERPDDAHRQDNRCEEVETEADKEPRRDSADHQELAVGEIDNAGKAEDQSDAHADQNCDARDRKTVHELLDQYFHFSNSIMASDRRALKTNDRERWTAPRSSRRHRIGPSRRTLSLGAGRLNAEVFGGPLL